MKSLLYCFIIFTVTTLSSNIIAQNFNRPVPENLFKYEFQEGMNGTNNYIFATMFKLYNSPSYPDKIEPYPIILDPNGYVYWYCTPHVTNVLDFKFIPSTNKFSYTYGDGIEINSAVLDLQFERIDTLQISGVQDIHDVQLAANGNWIIATKSFDTMDLSAFNFNGVQGDPATIVQGFGYEEQTFTGAFVQSWNSNDYLSPNETLDFWGYNPNLFDYCHGNAIEEDTDGNLLISYRHLNSIHKVNRQTGEVIWRLGGELSDFVFTNDNGFSGQHDVRLLSDGTVSLFDNSNMEGTTRGVIYTLDTIQWTATKVSEYIHPVGATAIAMGNYSIRENNESVLGYGLIYRPMPSATILDENQNIKAEYYFEDSVVSYRFLPFEITPVIRPEILCNWNGTSWQLTAPNGFTNYQWSTGDSTQSIVLSEIGTYQVWVNQGVGMLGSDPMFISDINNPCVLGIDELTNLESLSTYKYYDLFGKQIDTPLKNKLYLKVWSNGSVEKVMMVE